MYKKWQRVESQKEGKTKENKGSNLIQVSNNDINDNNIYTPVISYKE